MSSEKVSIGNSKDTDSQKSASGERPKAAAVVAKWRKSDSDTTFNRLSKLNDLARQEIKHEDILISNRLTASVISQSFLVSAYVHDKLWWIAVLGIALCILNFLSILAAKRTSDYYREILIELKKEGDEIFNFVGKRLREKSWGYIFAKATPIIIIIFWVVALLPFI